MIELRLPSNLPLPDRKRESLEHACGEIHGALREDLLALIIYGGLARGCYTAGTSDVNLLIVARELEQAHLDALIMPLSLAQVRFRLAPFILRETDFARSTDVFPLKFLDIKLHHRTIWGRDLLESIEISEEHLRLNGEMEAKNLALRLRVRYIQRGHRPERLEQLLLDTASSLTTILRAVLYLASRETVTDNDEVIRQGVHLIGLDPDVFQAIAGYRDDRLASDDEPDLKLLRDLTYRFMLEVRKVADYLDTMEV